MEAMKTDKTIWVCEKCGSKEVEVKQWVRINDESVMWDLDITDRQTWCPVCLDHNGIVKEDEYSDENEGYQTTQKSEGGVN